MEKRNRELIDLIAQFQHLRLCGEGEDMDWECAVTTSIDEEMEVTCCQEEEHNEEMDRIDEEMEVTCCQEEEHNEEMDRIDQEMGVTCCQEEEKMDWISSSNPNFCVWREREDEDDEA